MRKQRRRPLIEISLVGGAAALGDKKEFILYPPLRRLTEAIDRRTEVSSSFNRNSHRTSGLVARLHFQEFFNERNPYAFSNLVFKLSLKPRPATMNSADLFDRPAREWHRNHIKIEARFYS